MTLKAKNDLSSILSAVQLKRELKYLHKTIQKKDQNIEEFIAILANKLIKNGQSETLADVIR